MYPAFEQILLQGNIFYHIPAILKRGASKRLNDVLQIVMDIDTKILLHTGTDFLIFCYIQSFACI